MGVKINDLSNMLKSICFMEMIPVGNIALFVFSVGEHMRRNRLT